jgi:hypothetical protein
MPQIGVYYIQVKMMSPTKRILTAFSILAVTALACGVSVDLGTTPANTPLATPTLQQSSQDQLGTMVAATLQVYTQAAETLQAAATPTSTPIPPTTAPLTMTVSTDTNCYAGPSTSYGFVITVHPGTIVVVIGKDTAANYYVIETPNYPGSTCWLSGVYATLTGDASTLPEDTPSSLTTYTLSEPRSLNVSCTSTDISSSDSDWHDGGWGWGWHDGNTGWHDNSSDWTVNFRWKNTEPNAYAVRVYRNGWLIATLGAHGSSYTDTFRHRGHNYGVTYGVQAVKGNEVSSIVTINVNHCPGG